MAVHGLSDPVHVPAAVTEVKTVPFLDKDSGVKLWDAYGRSKNGEK